MAKTLKALLTPYRITQLALTADLTTLTADGRSSIVADRVVLSRTDVSQVAPAESSYSVSTTGILHATDAIDELLAGIYTASFQDASGAVGGFGFFAIGAADGDYWMAATYAEAQSLQLAMADTRIEDVDGTRKLKTYLNGTTTELIASKTALQPDGTNLTDPATQRLAGYQE